MAKRVFILGAGFSKAICSEMPIMGELGDAVQNLLDRADTPLPASMSDFNGDFEQLLSYLAERQPWLDHAEALRNRAAFLDVSRAVATILEERQRVALRRPEPAWLGTLIDYWDRMKSTVVTFNYDVLVEAAARLRLDAASWAAFYRAPVAPAGSRTAAVYAASPLDSFALLKLHGSVTWYWSGVDSIESDPIYDVGLRGGWELDGLTSPFDSLDQLLPDKVPMVVPPTATKSAFYDNAVLRSQWQVAAKAIAEAEEIVLVGYSLPASDTVVRSLLRTVFTGHTVTPVDLGRSVIDQSVALFGDRITDAYCGRDDPLATFVADNCG